MADFPKEILSYFSALNYGFGDSVNTGLEREFLMKGNDKDTKDKCLTFAEVKYYFSEHILTPGVFAEYSDKQLVDIYTLQESFQDPLKRGGTINLICDLTLKFTFNRTDFPSPGTTYAKILASQNFQAIGGRNEIYRTQISHGQTITKEYKETLKLRFNNRKQDVEIVLTTMNGAQIKEWIIPASTLAALEGDVYDYKISGTYTIDKSISG